MCNRFTCLMGCTYVNIVFYSHVCISVVMLFPAEALVVSLSLLEAQQTLRNLLTIVKSESQCVVLGRQQWHHSIASLVTACICNLEPPCWLLVQSSHWYRQHYKNASIALHIVNTCGINVNKELDHQISSGFQCGPLQMLLTVLYTSE